MPQGLDLATPAVLMQDLTHNALCPLCPPCGLPALNWQLLIRTLLSMAQLTVSSCCNPHGRHLFGAPGTPADTMQVPHGTHCHRSAKHMVLRATPASGPSRQPSLGTCQRSEWQVLLPGSGW